MSIYDQDFATLFKLLLPPDKRGDTEIAYGTVVTTPLQWLHDLTYNDYASGTIAGEYSGIITYNKNDKAFYNQAVYQAKQTTLGNVPTTGDDNDPNWLKVLDDFRGVRERVQYNGQKLSLEWILNKWFGTTFVQPDYNSPSSHSDFWIENKITDDGSFLLSLNSLNGPSYLALNNFAEDYMGLTYQAEVSNFTVHYPLSVIPSTASSPYLQMVSLITKYKLYGTIPQYIGY